MGWPGEGGLPKRFGSWVEGAELFDHAFFALSLREVGGAVGRRRRAARAGAGRHSLRTKPAVQPMPWPAVRHAFPHTARPPQAAAMDAQQRLLLEGCWEALGHSALAAAGALGPDAARAVGVSVGISYNEYYLNSAHQVGVVRGWGWGCLAGLKTLCC